MSNETQAGREGGQQNREGGRSGHATRRNRRRRSRRRTQDQKLTKTQATGAKDTAPAENTKATEKGKNPQAQHPQAEQPKRRKRGRGRRRNNRRPNNTNKQNKPHDNALAEATTRAAQAPTKNQATAELSAVVRDAMVASHTQEAAKPKPKPRPQARPKPRPQPQFSAAGVEEAPEKSRDHSSRTRARQNHAGVQRNPKRGPKRGVKDRNQRRSISSRNQASPKPKPKPYPNTSRPHGSRMPTRDETSAGGLVVSGLAEAVRGDGSVDLSKIYVALIGRLDRRGRLLWSMPKGHVEPNEDQRATAEREVWEETGIHGEVFAELGVIDYWFVSEGTRIHKTVHHHLLRFVDGDLNDEDPEVTEVDWVPVNTLVEHLAYADERKLARIAHDQLPEFARQEKAAGRSTPR